MPGSGGGGAAEGLQGQGWGGCGEDRGLRWGGLEEVAGGGVWGGCRKDGGGCWWDEGRGRGGKVWFGLVWFGLVWFGLVWWARGPWPCRCAARRPKAWGAGMIGGLLIRNYPAPIVTSSVTLGIEVRLPSPRAIRPPGSESIAGHPTRLESPTWESNPGLRYTSRVSYQTRGGAGGSMKSGQGGPGRDVARVGQGAERVRAGTRKAGADVERIAEDALRTHRGCGEGQERCGGQGWFGGGSPLPPPA